MPVVKTTFRKKNEGSEEVSRKYFCNIENTIPHSIELFILVSNFCFQTLNSFF